MVVLHGTVQKVQSITHQISFASDAVKYGSCFSCRTTTLTRDPSSLLRPDCRETIGLGFDLKKKKKQKKCMGKGR